MNASPSRSRGAPSSGRTAVFFLTVWLIAAAIIAIPVVLLVRGTADVTGMPSASGASTPPGTPSVAPPGPSGPATGTATTHPPLTLTVINTCGADGRGDCFLTIRSGATGSSTDLGRMDEGDTFTGECWISGQSVRASASGLRTGRWVRLPAGGYVSGAYVSRLGELPAC